MKIKIIFLTFLFGFNYLNFYSQNTFNNAQGNGDWATPGNWSIGVVPQAGIGAGIGILVRLARRIGEIRRPTRGENHARIARRHARGE